MYTFSELLSCMYEGKSQPTSNKTEGLVRQLTTWLLEERTDITESGHVFKELPPLLSSQFAADVILTNRDPYSSDPIIPLICFQINSEPTFNETIAKLIAVCVDQLRLLMNIDNSITETSGFAFPNEALASMVAEVHVAWASRFEVTIEYLAKEQVKDAVLKRKARMRRLWFEEKLCEKPVPQDMTILPLSAQELEQNFGESSRQISSNSSIVVHNSQKKLYFKWHLACFSQDWDASMAVSSVVFKPLPNKFVFGNLRFDVYPEMDRSLSNLDSIRQGTNRFVFVKLLFEALEMIHTRDNRAHLDVRIENTCFWLDSHGKHQLLLFDFDRSRWADENAFFISQLYGPEGMYSPKSSWQTRQLDLKQLGLALGGILEDSFDMDAPFAMFSMLLFPAQALLTSLIERGEWSEEAFQEWVRSAQTNESPSSPRKRRKGDENTQPAFS